MSDTTEQQPVNSDSYAVDNEGFYDIILPSESLRTVATEDYPFAHEAPVFVRGLNKLFFVSNRLGDHNSTNQRIELRTLDLESNKAELLPAELAEQLPMANGAINWPGADDTIALLTQGLGDIPPAVNKVNLRTMKHEVVLNSFNGKQFNSPNDVVAYMDATIWFTDPSYGHDQNFRPGPQLDNQVYAFNPDTGAIKVVAKNFVRPNGITFSPDYKTAYVTDTGEQEGNNKPLDQTIYAFNVIAPEKDGDVPQLQNRRVYATAKSGHPDGIKLDSKGNVYTGTQAGVEVFDPQGRRLGTIRFGPTTNIVFVDNMLYGLCEEKIQAVRLQATGAKLP
eukprot:GHRR01024058.1.p1 GENE.GHRR01024058.1~~GHRR01024058.1.p1  ORF type:complete len:336 (+),score=102.05 GHRR01024058.1:606-1613(+)